MTEPHSISRIVEKLDSLEQVLREVIEVVYVPPNIRSDWRGTLFGNPKHEPHLRTSVYQSGAGEPMFIVMCSCGWESCAKQISAVSATWESHVKNGGHS